MTKQTVKCAICRKPPTPGCTWAQGRCPHIPPPLSIGKKMNHPDPKLHRNISFVKSVFRIVAGIALVWPQSLVLAGAFLILAEVLGIAEELV